MSYDRASVRQVLNRIQAEKRSSLNPAESKILCDAYGIPLPQEAIASSAEEAARLAAEIGFPVVMKIISPDILHKTDAGGVVLNIADAGGLADAARSILQKVRARHPEAKLEGVLVQRMEKGLAELILGYKRDPQVGPVVVLGIGGVLAEIYKDFAVRLAPVSVDDARAMIEEVKGLAVIRGYRGMPKGDLAALARAVSALSQIAFIEAVTEAEINPLIVKREGDGVIAVDGLIVRK
jgi:succinyl-CoA synthetase beta subunit